MIGNSNDETNFPDKLLLTNRQVLNLRKAFANYLSTDIKLSKAQLSKVIQSGGFPGRLLGPLLKTGLPLMKNIIQPLAKNVLIPLALTAAESAAEAGIYKRILGSGTTALIISIDEMEDIMKIFQALADSGLLLKRVSETIQNKIKEQKKGFLIMLFGTLGPSLLGNILAGKGVVRAGYGSKGNSSKQSKKGKGFLFKDYPLTNFEIQKYYQNEPRFNGVYSRDDLPDKVKTGTYLINLDEYSDIETHWIALYILNNNVTYFDSFGLNIFQKKSNNLLKDLQSQQIFLEYKNMIQ